ncbi:MAG: toll/interleukin-1 receptor domain-containing protein [Gammaproteobacteria bacterium]|nr:toll/interleukin-1 receptor domain-containing protein [Gammaproteobacteria bacterium]
MSQVFISYASSDRETARSLAALLEQQGWSVWWDRHIPPGRSFDDVIEAAIDAAGCVVVLWSRAAVASDWVKAEAEEGLRRGILVPAMIEAVRIPLGYRRIQAADLSDWNSDAPTEGTGDLLRAVADTLVPDGGRRPPDASAGDAQRAADVAPPARDDAVSGAWQVEVLVESWYRRKLRVALADSTHVIDVRSTLGMPNTVELDGEVVARNEEISVLGWQGRLEFAIDDGAASRAAVVDLDHHWMTDKITACRVTVDGRVLYDGEPDPS